MTASSETMPDSVLDKQNLNAWQKSLLPWSLTVLTILAAAFIYLATNQLYRISNHINNYKTSELDKIFISPKDGTLVVPEGLKANEFARLYVLAKMDEQLMNKHYTQGGVLLTARLYAQYLGFFTGMLLAFVGAIFIMSKLREGESTIFASNEKAAFSLVSTSPGLIFCVLGTILMLSTILTHNEIQINDQAVYLNAEMINPGQVTHDNKSEKDSTKFRMGNSFPPADK